MASHFVLRFPRWTRPILYVAVAASCGDNGGTGPAPQESVDDFAATLPSWQTFSPVLPDSHYVLDDGGEETDEELGGATYKCTNKPYSLTKTPDKIVTLDPDVNVLWLGALLQGSGYKDGVGSLAEWSVRERAPLDVSIDLLSGQNTRRVERPTVSSVNQALGELVQAAHAAGHRGGSSVSYSMQETHSIFQATLSLGISTKYLGPTITAGLGAEHKVDERTITAYFVQRMFTASFVLPNRPSDMFNSEFTAARLQEERDRGVVGSSNLPVYVASIVFGRILVFTFTSNTTVDSIRLALSAALATDSVGIDAKLARILTTSDIRVVTVGGEGRNALDLIKSGRLADYFNEDAAITSARPISYTVRNLGDNSIARVSETTEYNLKECTAVPTTGQLVIDVTPNDATVHVVGAGNFNFGPEIGDQRLVELDPGGYSVRATRQGFTGDTVDVLVEAGKVTEFVVPLVDPTANITGAIYTVQPTRIIYDNVSCAETYPDVFHTVNLGSRLLTQRTRANYYELGAGQADSPTGPGTSVWNTLTDTVRFSNMGGTTTDTVMAFSGSVFDADDGLAAPDDKMANVVFSYVKTGVPTGTFTKPVGVNGCSVRLELIITKTADTH